MTNWDEQVARELSQQQRSNGGRHAHRAEDDGSSWSTPVHVTSQSAAADGRTVATDAEATAPALARTTRIAVPVRTTAPPAVAPQPPIAAPPTPATSPPPTLPPPVLSPTVLEPPPAPTSPRIAPVSDPSASTAADDGSSVRAGGQRLPQRMARGLAAVAGLHATRDVREYVELHRQLTAAVTSSRRVAVLAAAPAQGSTTVAALLATALATRRVDPVLLVDAAAGTFHPSLHHMFGATPVRTIGDLAGRPPRVSARADFEGHLTQLGRDMWLIPAMEVPRTSGRYAPDEQMYVNAVSPFIRYFDISVTDLSATPQSGTAKLVFDRAHALCLVTSPTEAGFEWVTSRLREMRDDLGHKWAGRTIVVVNHPQPTTDRLRAVRSRLRPRRERHAGIPVVHLGYDPQLRPGFPAHPNRLSPATHLAAMRMAAEVLGTAMPIGPDPRPSADQRRSPDGPVDAVLSGDGAHSPSRAMGGRS